MFTSTTLGEGLGYLPPRILVWGLGWEGAEVVATNVISGIIRFVHSTEWPKVAQVIFATQIVRDIFSPKTILWSFKPKMVVEDILPSKIVCSSGLYKTSQSTILLHINHFAWIGQVSKADKALKVSDDKTIQKVTMPK